jgi:hypothetical protein
MGGIVMFSKEQIIARVFPSRLIRLIGLPLSSLLLGAFAFKSPQLVPLSLLVLTLWATADSRWSALFVGTFYFIGVTLDVPQVVLGYHDVDCILAIKTIVLYWPVAACIFGTPFALFWCKKGRLTVRAPLLLLSLLMPPFGTFGVGHPVLSAGVLFPATGFLGVVLLLLCSTLYVTSQVWIAIVLSGILSLRYGFLSPPSDPSIFALDTSFETSSTRTAKSLMAEWIRPFLLLPQLSRISSDIKIIVLPEEIAGTFTTEVLRRWSGVAKDLENKSLIVGGDLLSPTHPSNSLMVFDGPTITLLYTQRQPIPFSMWQPWNKASYPLNLIGRSVAKVEGKRIGLLLCYELLAPWTVLQTATWRPKAIIGATNISYARGTKLHEFMELHRELWQSLFGIPFIVAHNR